ncbi:protein kinase domain-containing protein [Cryptosporidium serpentis]
MKVPSKKIVDIQLIRNIYTHEKTKVYCASGKHKDNQENIKIALKMYRKDMIINSSNVWNERKVLERIYHHCVVLKNSAPQLIYLYDTFIMQDDQGNSNICFALDYALGDPLHIYIKNKEINILCIKNIIKQLVEAIGILHSIGIIHRDIKCNNIIFNEDTGQIKVIDMSLSCFIEKDERLTQFCGSFHAMPPEMICVDKPNYSLPFDWWSVGILTVPPFGYHPEQSEQQLNRINNSPDSIIFPWELKYLNETDTNKDLILAENFIKNLLVSDESKRLGSVNGFKEVYSHPWISAFTLK